MNIIKKKANQIKPYWRNPRKNRDAVSKVKKSIEDYGFNSPIVLDKKGIIIAGHTRFSALNELGWNDIPCVVLDISEEKAKEYRIVDNKTAEFSDWDYAKLIPELRELDTETLGEYFVNIDQLIDVATPQEFADEITQEMIDQKTEIMEEGFDQQNSEDEIKLYCSHCGENNYYRLGQILFDKIELLKKLKIGGSLLRNQLDA